MIELRYEWCCPNCNTTQPASNFQEQKRTGKISGWCRKCRTEAEKNRRRRIGIPEKKFSIIEDGKKLCMKCNKMMLLSEFHPSIRGSGGLSSYCKECSKIHFTATKEEARERTARYREKHKYRWRALHRINQYHYRNNIEATSDGTVTDEFLKKVLSTEICPYCVESIEKEQRTIDHIIPLSKGGAHSALNITMACNSCNSAKADMDLEEFLTKRGLV